MQTRYVMHLSATQSVDDAGPNMNESLSTLAELEAVIGKAPSLVHLKAIDHLDAGALRWIGKSPLMFAGFGDGSGIALTVGGGAPGWAAGDAHRLRLPAAMLDDATVAQPGIGFGSIFVLPAISEVMRVNGKVVRAGQDEIVVAVEECYLHCGKALLRSEFWKALPAVAAPGEAAAFVPASRFMALATINAQGQADVSPKGDMAGTMARLREGRLWFADRPGNKRIDSFRNIITQPRMAGLLVIPGSAHVVSISGKACITPDVAMRAEFTVQDKVPALVTCVDDLVIELRESAAIKRAPLWPAERPEDIDPIKLGIAHLKICKSMAVKLAATAMSSSGLLEKGIARDYKRNLF